MVNQAGSSTVLLNGDAASAASVGGGASAANAPFDRKKSYIPKPEDALGESQRLMLKWENLTYKVTTVVKKEKSEKIILDNMSGSAQPGQMLAIMGPSGGGKTSLLNVLAGRVKDGKVTLNNRPLPKKFNKIAAYVMQDDLLFGTLTPREIFTFAASLRLHHLKPQERKERVEYLIMILSLNACADTYVGRPMHRGLSGGERKRTAIGYEMVTNPSLIFLDEPTTGLDSFTALSVARSMQKLATHGRTIVCTIHQPSSEIFALFNRLILLSSGKVTYMGPASRAIDYFAALGYQCPTYSNPSDYYMRVLKTRDETDQQRVDKIAQDWVVHGKELLTEVMQVDVSKAEAESDKMLAEVDKPTPGPSWPKETWYLTMRSLIDTYRNPVTFYARLAQFVIVGLFLGATYIPLGNDQASIQNRMGVLFFVTMGFVMLNANAIILTFPLERGLLVRDQYSGMYRVWTYFLGKMISELPFGIVIAFASAIVMYWFVGLSNTAAQFFIFVLISWVQMYVGGAIGLILGCAMPNAELAVILSPVVIIPFMLFGGFYTNLNAIGTWISWVQWISPFKWGFEAFAINEFTNLQLTCAASELVGPPNNQVCPVTNGDAVITELDMTSSNVWEPTFILLGIAILLRVGALFALEMQTRKALRRN